MRMKRPQGYKHIKCPHCGEKIRLNFRTMHRMKIEVEKGDMMNIPFRVAREEEIDLEEGDFRG